MSVQYGGDKITFSDGSTVGSGWTGMKNRLINSDMRIDQRNAGASVSLSSTPVFLLDRWQARLGTSTGSTGIKSTTAPAGFSNSVLLTIGTGASPSSSTGSNYYNQIIEGFNFADLNWGTANAQPATLSFWVRSSLTGNFGVCVSNNDINPSYPTFYTINSANTWEYKTITIAGPTSGTFATDNTGCVRVFFDWGNGSDYKGTANTWANADYRGGATGTTNICATSGATWYVTGVQLEKGSTATSFDYRPYGTELALCQRYYYEISANTTTKSYPFLLAVAYSSTNMDSWIQFPVTMRALPTGTYGSATSAYRFYRNAANESFNTISTDELHEFGALVYTSGLSHTAGTCGMFHIRIPDGAYLKFTAEL